MGFLVLKDYDLFITKTILTEILLESDTTLASAEMKAQAQIAGYLTPRYDVAKIFVNVNAWDATITYNKGDMVFLDVDGTITTYVAQEDNTNQTTDQTAYWLPGDTRYQEIVEAMLHLVIYKIHKPLAAAQIPKNVIDDYTETKAWLGLVNEMKLGHTLPLLDVNRKGEDNQIVFGSVRKRHLRY